MAQKSNNMEKKYYSSLVSLFKDNGSSDSGYHQYKVVLMALELKPIGIISASCNNGGNNPYNYVVYLCLNENKEEVLIPLDALNKLIQFIVDDNLGDIVSASKDKKLPKYQKLFTMMNLTKE